MKILITGNKGFIGSKVQSELENNGHEINGYDIVDGFDLLNLTQLENEIKKIDVVYHIAAEADLNKMQTLDGARNGVTSNVDATHNISYLCAKYKKWLIYASTVCVYGNVDEHPEREDYTLPNPSELYACSKYSAEWIIKGYGKNFNMPWTILRFATIYGEGMRQALGMHIFFKQALKGENITVHGNGRQDRTLTYIYDLVDGIVSCIKYPENAKNQIFNLSSKESISALQMAVMVKNITGSDSEIVHIKQRDNQTYHEDFDVNKAKTLLNWESNTLFSEGLLKTFEWIKNNDS